MDLLVVVAVVLLVEVEVAVVVEVCICFDLVSLNTRYCICGYRWLGYLCQMREPLYSGCSVMCP